MNFEKVGCDDHIKSTAIKIILTIKLIFLSTEFIFSKIKTGMKAKVDNLIIFPPTSIPCKIACKKI